MPLPKNFRLKDYFIDSVRSEAGNFSKVYLAKDLKGHSWAIKEFAPKQRYSRDAHGAISPVSGKQKEFQWALKRFREECQFLQSTQHPHIVMVREHFSGNGTYYVVMELFEESLEERVRHRGPQSQNEMMGWVAQVMDALRYCHGRGILHLDLSPNNIMLRPDGSAALIDFGFSKLGEGSNSRSSKLVACEHYSAPEKHQHTSRDLDGRADIYSLGAVMNFAISGVDPLDCRDRMSDRDGAGLTPAGVSKRASRAETGLKEAIDRAFRYRQADRFQKIDDLFQAVHPQLAAAQAQRALDDQRSQGPDEPLPPLADPQEGMNVDPGTGDLSDEQRKQIAVVLLLVMIFACLLLIVTLLI